MITEYRAIPTIDAVVTEWNPLLRGELEKPYYRDLQNFVDRERRHHSVFPPADQVFAALHATNPGDVKAVLLGQDPYHGRGQAHGLCFSVQLGVPIPPSLRNIHTELRTDLGLTPPRHGNLAAWARAGVLMLNTTLTVREGQPGSHQGQGWETFTDEVIKTVNARNARVVFILWGAHARKKKILVTNPAHVVIEGPHPSPLSAHNGFFGSRPFSRTNEALIDAGREPVDWSLPEL
jgi:uracil-DNA glycosylase